MAKRKRSKKQTKPEDDPAPEQDLQDEDDPDQPEPDEDDDDGPPAQMAVSMRGTAGAVRKAARQTIARGDRKAAPEDEDEEETKEFAEAVRDPNNSVVVIRSYPTQFMGRDVTGPQMEVPTPTNLQHLRKIIADTCGGESYVLRVVDLNGEIIAARELTIPGLEPRIVPQQGQVMDNIGDSVKDWEEEMDPAEEDVTRIRNQIKVERLRQQLAELKEGTRHGVPMGTDKIAALENELNELKRAEQVERVVAPLQNRIQELEELLEKKMAKPTQDPQSIQQLLSLQNEVGNLKMQLQQAMQDGPEKGSAFRDIINLIVAQNNQTNQLMMNMISAMMTNNQKGNRDSLETVGGMLDAMGGLMSLVNPDARAEPKGAIERLIDHVPDVIDLLRNQQRQGANITRAEIQKAVAEMMPGIQAHTRSVIERSVAQKLNVQQHPTMPQQIPQLQQMPRPAPIAQPAPQQPVSQPQPQQKPKPVSPPIAREDLSSAAEDVAPGETLPESDDEEEGDDGPLSPQEEAEDRVNAVLETVYNELKLEVRAMQWPNMAYLTLPKSVLEGIIYAQTDEDVYDAIKEYGDRELMTVIWDLIQEPNTEHRDRLVYGINAIKATAEKERQAAAQMQQQRAAQQQAPAPAAPPQQG